MNKSELVLKLYEAFEKEYGPAACSLDYAKPHELLISTQLAAQGTDARVNIVTKDLYQKYQTIDDFADADQAELENDIRPTGFFRNKAKNIIGCCQMLRDVYHYEIPDTMEELTKLPGVGRKTANIMLGDYFHKPAVVVDTHCIRLSNRMGLTKNSDPYKIELDLQKIIQPEMQSDFCHYLVYHGRAYCKAINPQCEACPVKDICPKITQKKSRKKKES
mgnify:CR=1 FL=1